MKKAPTLLLTTLTALIFAGGSAAEIYKTVDKNGKVTYTDKPGGAQVVEEVDLPPINSQSSPEESSPDESAVPVPPTAEQTPAATSYNLTIVSPESGSQIPMGQATVVVSVELSPGLQDGDQLQALLNGTPFGEPSVDTQLVLDYLYRGENQLSVAVIDADGNQLAESPAITLFVQRPIARPTPQPKAPGGN